MIIFFEKIGGMKKSSLTFFNQDGGFSNGGGSPSKRKRYVRAVMSLDARRPDHLLESTLCFTSSNLKDMLARAVNEGTNRSKKKGAAIVQKARVAEERT